jgi:hypothetical protein
VVGGWGGVVGGGDAKEHKAGEAVCHPLLGHHHLHELLVVHLTVTIHIRLANHLVHLLISQLLAQVGHHVTQLDRPNHKFPVSRQRNCQSRESPLPTSRCFARFASRGKPICRGCCWQGQGRAHLRRRDVPVAVLVEHLERLLQLLLRVGVLCWRGAQGVNILNLAWPCDAPLED